MKLSIDGTYGVLGILWPFSFINFCLPDLPKSESQLCARVQHDGKRSGLLHLLSQFKPLDLGINEVHAGIHLSFLCDIFSCVG